MKKIKLYCRTPIYLLLVFLFSCQTNKKNETPPNIIFVLADDLGYGDLSSFNPEGKIHTANLDQLASDGIKFTDAHTSSAVCTPTRYGIITGRYNWRSRLKNGVLTGISKALLPDDRTTVASLLTSKGYHTAFIGKWHLGWDWSLRDDQSVEEKGWTRSDFELIDFTKPVTHTPNDLGFAYAYGHSGSLDMAPYVYVENGMSTAIPFEETVNKSKYGWWRQGPTAPDFVHEDVTPNFFNRAMDYIKKESETENPFFLYLALPSPHTPILPTEEYMGKSNLNPYGDFVLMVDDYMGRLMQTIQDAGIEENTLVVFTSDNGCSPQADFDLLDSLGHDPSYIYRGHKADIYEGGHRVPFIVKWPSKIKKGTSSDQLLCTTDFMATCADILDIPLADNQGEDSFSFLSELIQKSSNKPKREAVVHHSLQGKFAIRKGDWKLIMCPGSGGWSYPAPGKDDEILSTLPKYQLYNLKEDPEEQDNLYPENSEKYKELKKLLTDYIVRGRSTPGAIQENDPYDKIWHQIAFIDEP